MPSLSTTPIELYGEKNKTFTLFSYTPVYPHGSGQYNRNPLPPEVARGYVRDHLKAARDSDRHVEVTLNGAIKVGYGRRFQIVGCKVTRFPRKEAPTTQQEPLSEMRNNRRINLKRELVLRICDPKFSPSDFMAPCGNEELAEGDFSRDYWAMRHFHERGITGVGYLGPRFYGGYILKLPAGTDRRRRKLFRYVYVSITERLYGYTAEDLCFRSGPGNEGWLMPHNSPADFERADGSLRWITFDQETRNKVMKLVIHGLVVSMHNSVEHQGFGPEAAFITYRDGHKNLPDVRVVHVGHAETQVWRFTGDAFDDSEVHCIQQLPYPPHPYERFCWEGLDDWHGWIPDEVEFDDWLTRSDTFGPLDEARDVLADLGPGAKWPHKYAMYSTFETLDQIEDDGCKKVSIAPRAAGWLYLMGDMETLHALCMSSVMAQKSLEKWVTKLVQHAVGPDDAGSSEPSVKNTQKQTTPEDRQRRLEELQGMARGLSINNQKLDKLVGKESSLATAMESLSLGESRRQTPQSLRPTDTPIRHYMTATISSQKRSSSYTDPADTPATPTGRSSSNPRERLNFGATAQ